MLSSAAEQSLTPPADSWFSSDIADGFDLWSGGITHGSHVLAQTPQQVSHTAKRSDHRLDRGSGWFSALQRVGLNGHIFIRIALHAECANYKKKQPPFSWPHKPKADPNGAPLIITVSSSPMIMRLAPRGRFGNMLQHLGSYSGS